MSSYEHKKYTANLIPLSIFNESYSDLIEKGAQHVHLVIQTHILRNICFALKGNILCCNAVVFLSYWCTGFVQHHIAFHRFKNIREYPFEYVAIIHRINQGFIIEQIIFCKFHSNFLAIVIMYNEESIECLSVHVRIIFTKIELLNVKSIVDWRIIYQSLSSMNSAR